MNGAKIDVLVYKNPIWYANDEIELNALCLSAIRDKTKANLQYVYPRYCVIIFIACNIYDIFLNIR